MSWCVVRREHGPLHIATPNGRGYTTICGHTLAGEDLDVPRPKFPATKTELSRYWGRLWSLELQCMKCSKQIKSKPKPPAAPAVGVTRSSRRHP